MSGFQDYRKDYHIEPGSSLWSAIIFVFHIFYFLVSRSANKDRFLSKIVLDCQSSKIQKTFVKLTIVCKVLQKLVGAYDCMGIPSTGSEEFLISFCFFKKIFI